MQASTLSQLSEIGARIRDMREIAGLTTAEMAKKTEVPEADYIRYEAGETDLPFTFLHKCALAFGIEITDILEGHNIFRFDLPYIEERAKRHKVRLQLGRDGSVPAKRNSRISIAERTVNYTRYDIYGRHVADTFHLLLFYDAIHRSLESYNLKYAAKHFGVAAPDRTYVEGAEISSAWEKDRENLLKYALDDVRETRALSAILSPSYFYQAQLVPISYQNCIVRGNATRIDALLASEYLKAGHALPAPERGRPFSGALTRALDSGVFENIDHCDVRSLYTSIILSEQWTPGRDSLGVFPRLL